MRKPDPAEARMCVYSRELARQLRFSPYRLTDRTTKDGEGPCLVSRVPLTF